MLVKLTLLYMGSIKICEKDKDYRWKESILLVQLVIILWLFWCQTEDIFWNFNKVLNWITFFVVRNVFLTWLRVWISKNWNASIVTLFIWSRHPQFSNMCFYRPPVQSRFNFSLICDDWDCKRTAFQFLNSLIPFPNSSIFPSSGGIFVPRHHSKWRRCISRW